MFSFDDALIKKLKEQDHHAFNTFYLETVDTFFRYVQSTYFVADEDIEDILADFYMKRRQAVKKYDSNRSFPAFVRTVFKNTIKDHFKKTTDMPFTIIDTQEGKEGFADNIEDDIDLTAFLEQDYQYEQIAHAMQQLDEISKEIIHLKFIEEKTTDEMMMILDISAANVRQRLSRALQHLKTLLATT